MSKRNGDKARFNRQRKKKLLNRKRNREMLKALESDSVFEAFDSEPAAVSSFAPRTERIENAAH
jgi:hypothetical protein